MQENINASERRKKNNEIEQKHKGRLTKRWNPYRFVKRALINTMDFHDVFQYQYIACC